MVFQDFISGDDLNKKLWSRKALVKLEQRVIKMELGQSQNDRVCNS